MNKKSNSFINIISVLLTVLILALAASTASAFASPAKVDLGTTEDFVILSQSGISTTGTTLITGDIGVSPIGYAAITGFALNPTIPDGSNTFATSSLVNGKIYASDYTEPTPSKMTTAINDLRDAYVDGAGRPTPNEFNLYDGNLGGKTLAPGLYKWTSGVTIPTEVILSGGANDVWIFQIAGDLTVASATPVTLIGGAQAKNIFWVVGGGVGVEIGTTAHVEGNILATKAIHLRTDATLNGRALAETAVTLDANVVTAPPDTTPPVITLVGTSPIDVVVGSPYTDAGATALDDVDGDITSSIVTDNPVDTAVSGTYAVTYDVTDAAGNAATQVTRTVNVVDTPIFVSAKATSDTNIDIVFDQNITIVGTPVWATDVHATNMTATGGSASGKILHVTVASLANTAYTAIDLAIVQDTVRNIANERNGAITGKSITDGQAPAAPVINAPKSPTNDTTPTITGTGENGATVKLNSSIAGQIAVTAVVADGNWSITPTTALTNVTHSLTAVQTDTAGNPSAASGAKALIVDTTQPVITLIGNSSIIVEGGSVYIDAGATALDNVDGNRTSSIVIVNPVNTTVPGIYNITYNVNDTAGNHATMKTRTVNVVDTTPPVITLNGVNPVWVVVGSVYTDAGATALDIVDGYKNGSIVRVNPVNTAVPGIYNVTYNVNDTAGNHAAQKTRTVNVVDLDLENSTVSAVPNIVNENGDSKSTITVTARNNINQGVIPGASVVLTSSGMGRIINVTNTTDSNGEAKFTIDSTEPGTVELTATVLGKQLNHKAVVTFGFDYKLGLNKGYNLVSVPRTLANSSVSALNTTKVDKIYYYDTVSGVWKSAFYTSGNWSGTLTTIDDGKGYWMNATAPTEVQVVLKTLDLLQLPPEYPLKAGWNMVGYTSLSLALNMDIDDYFSSLRNPASGEPIWVTAYIWENGVYRQARPGNWMWWNSFDNAMRTEGYWVYLNSDGKLVP